MKQLVLLLLLSCSGCALRRGGPDFEEWYKHRDFTAARGPHRGASVTFEVLSASTSETYTVLGPKHCALNVQLRVTNHSAQPYALQQNTNTLGAQMMIFAVDAQTLNPGQTLELKQQVNINPFTCGNGNLVTLDGVRVQLIPSASRP